MERTILLSASDVLLIDEASHTEIETKRLRFGHVRLFALSVLLGLLLGTMLCVFEPERSRAASARARAWGRSFARLVTTAADHLSRHSGR